MIELESALKKMLDALNEVPFDHRCKEIVKARTLVQVLYDNKFNKEEIKNKIACL